MAGTKPSFRVVVSLAVVGVAVASCATVGTVTRLAPVSAPSQSAFTPLLAAAFVTERRDKDAQRTDAGQQSSSRLAEGFAERLRRRHLFRTVSVVDAAAAERLLRSPRRGDAPVVIELVELMTTSLFPSVWDVWFRMITFRPRVYYFRATLTALVHRPRVVARSIDVLAWYRVASRQAFPAQELRVMLESLLRDLYDQAINRIADDAARHHRAAGSEAR